METGKEKLSISWAEHEKVVPLTRIQMLIGERMQQSKQDKPCFYLQRNVDVTELVGFRAKYSKQTGVKISTNDFFIRAMGLAVAKFPMMAGSFIGEAIYINKNIGVGLAVAAPQGLVVPVIKEADKKSLVETVACGLELIDKARENRLRLDELEGACITLSNLGMFGIDSFIAIVPPGQASILAVGRPVSVPMRYEGMVTVKKQMSITLSADRMVVYPSYAAEFLDFIAEQLENPLKLAI